MPTVISTRNAEVQRLLASPACAHLGLQVEVVSSGRAALAQTRSLKPALAILEPDLPEIDGCEVSQRMKLDHALRDCRVLLVWNRPLGRVDLEQVARARCDDLVVLPLGGEEFFCRVADLLGVPRRRSFRVAVKLRAQLEGTDFVREGYAENLSLHGALVRLERPLEVVDTVHVRLSRPHDGQVTEVDARVVSRRDGARLLGLEFQALSRAACAQLETLGLWHVALEDGLQRVYLEGDLVETTELAGLAQRLAGRVDFAGAGIRYINSGGAHLWVQFLRSLTAVEEYTFSQCSVAFTTHASLALGLLGRGRVVSFMAPYRCAQCDRDHVRLLQAAAVAFEDGTWTAPRFRCPACDGTLGFDEMPERYCALLKRG